ncbi:hypothetical protein Ddye_000196 [Dipteronia dyeriana]|uniref:Uncharacterized protein n=1 Tax=Dipteronia dyeriana TaxID=168575 RepID=A0AAD9XLW6_9ROSI|nr:hypothetical protein Ddye_000196 [Dipteronia dyeriana]
MEAKRKKTMPLFCGTAWCGEKNFWNLVSGGRLGMGSLFSSTGDKWIPRLFTFRITSQPKLDNNAKVDVLISPSGSWNSQILRENFNQDDVKRISYVYPPVIAT